jgi:putative FmdB family regulatory protein
MPTYEYICQKCGHQFDKFQPISSAPLVICPEEQCGRKRWGKGKVKRVIGAGAGLIFKGSGFYITDYRSKNYQEAAKKESSSPAAKPSSNGSEAKTAPKTEPKKTGASNSG